ncbi:hypothetical protein [Magnetospirillum sp. UT-4]|uniref:hypothetical protein n=1 Tax=Magnetospirillum sp. UT-4 TaxID=2681467 RepID=UPI00137EAECE|nr:hypothetical protein [Magnetospirillum sp. UT-4]CAA7614262.1 conserved membrane hypothetical protein [Magnetospirillum sp. UT-4]
MFAAPASPHWQGWRILAVPAVALLMAAPALWNGYPLIYFDSEDYVTISFAWEPIVYRILTYGAFVSVAKPFGTLWAVVAAQALIVAWVLHEAVWAWIARYRPQVYVALGAMLAVFTGLPWVVSQVMADVFAGVAILGIAVLAFGDSLPRWRRLAVLVPLTAIAISVHMSHVAVAAGLMLVLGAIWLATRLSLRMPRPRLGLAALAVALGTLLVPSVHWLATGRAYFSESGQVLQLALFVQDGLAKKYLDEVCPQGAAFKMCEHKDELPFTADEFLWGESPFDELGGWKAMHDEASAIVRGAIATFPLDVAGAMLDNTLVQLELIASGEDLVPMTWHFVKTQLKYYPDDFRAFRFARQQRHRGISFDVINRVQVPVARAAEIAALGLIVFAWRRRDRISGGLLVAVVIALLGNAFVCGALSNPHDRYQSRVVWLALFASTVAAIRLDQRFTRRRGELISPARGG